MVLRNIFGLFLQTDNLENLIVPDSIQKEKFAETVKRLAALDVHDIVSEIVSWLIWTGIKICIALAIYYAGRWLLKRVVKMIDALMTRRKTELSLHTFLLTLVKTVGYIILIVAIVSVLGVNLTIFAAVLASAGLAIGMALSSTLQNFAGGVMILVLRPYSIGDYISSQGVSGTVTAIRLFTTTVQTTDKQTIYIPNNMISTSIINNYTTSVTRRCSWKVSVAYGDDYDAVRAAMLAIIMRSDKVLKEPAAYVRIDAMADSAVVIEARAWVLNNDYWDVLDNITECFYKELPAAGAHFPFPQLDVHIDRGA